MLTTALSLPTSQYYCVTMAGISGIYLKRAYSSNLQYHSLVKVQPSDSQTFMSHGPHLSKKVDSWMRHNKLSLNYSTTVYMIFNSDKKQSSPFRVQIGSRLINRGNSTKYVGMHLDNKLNWDTHISKLESKLSCYSGIFYRI